MYYIHYEIPNVIMPHSLCGVRYVSKSKTTNELGKVTCLACKEIIKGFKEVIEKEKSK